MAASRSLRKTPLHARHLELGARMVDFAGYEMPVSYDGILAEHRRVRNVCGLFDVSHMGEADVRGAAAASFLDGITTNAVGELGPLQAQYTLLLNRRGGVIDDLILYRLDDRYLLVVNAANVEKDFEWISGHVPADVDFRNVSEETALLAWQGPKAAEILDPLADVDLTRVPGFGIVEGRVSGVPVVLARTGYTGEDGFEIFVPAERAAEVWDALLEAGRPHGAGPAGLGARDTLRLEKQFRLYGQDMDENVTALEAGLGWVVRMDKGDFVGRDALTAQKTAGVPNTTVGLRITEPGRHIPRPGCEVLVDGTEVGRVTSGTFSPVLEEGIALARVRRGAARSAEFRVRIRNREARAVRVRKTFV
jgi:aminomethyltransferase